MLEFYNKKKSTSRIWDFFWNIPGHFYLELFSETPAQDFNLHVNIGNFFPVFLLVIINNSLHLFKFTLHLKLLLNWCHLEIVIKEVSKLPAVITAVTIDKGLRKSTIGKSQSH